MSQSRTLQNTLIYLAINYLEYGDNHSLSEIKSIVKSRPDILEKETLALLNEYIFCTRILSPFFLNLINGFHSWLEPATLAAMYQQPLNSSGTLPLQQVIRYTYPEVSSSILSLLILLTSTDVLSGSAFINMLTHQGTSLISEVLFHNDIIKTKQIFEALLTLSKNKKLLPSQILPVFSIPFKPLVAARLKAADDTRLLFLCNRLSIALKSVETITLTESKELKELPAPPIKQAMPSTLDPYGFTLFPSKIFVSALPLDHGYVHDRKEQEESKKHYKW